MSTFIVQSPLVFTEGVDHYFDSNLQPVRTYQTIDLLFLMIKEKDSRQTVQMLLLEEDKPYPSDADALFYYLQKKNMREIFVNGGARIIFNTAENTLNYYGGSYSFPHIGRNEMITVSKTVWPKIDLSINTRIRHGLSDWNQYDLNKLIFMRFD